MTVKRLSLGIALGLALLAIIVGFSNNALAANVCTPTGTVSGTYAQNGAGDLCFQTSDLCSYVNSWNLDTLEVNGTSYTNQYVPSNAIAPLNGVYIIHYVGSYPWSHFEIGGTCSGGGDPTNTPVVATPTLTNTPAAATNTPTPTNTPAAATSTSTNGGTLKIQLATGGTDNSQQSQFHFRVQNAGSSTQSNISVRVYFTLDGSNTASSYVLEKYYDQSGFATVSGPTQLSGSIYYFTVNYGSAALSGNGSWELDTALHLNSWAGTFSATNDWWHTSGSLPSTFTDWPTIPAYISGSLVWGSEPGSSVATNTPAYTPTSGPSPTATITPTSSAGLSNALYIGRFNTSDPVGPKSAWSATTIRANFTGTGISADLYSSGDNWYNVIIDGVVRTPVHLPAGTNGSVTLASGLAAGNHTIEFVRRTEAWVGDVQFRGFTVTGGQLLAPPAPSSKRIEFIGDSITAGYGNEGADQYQSFTTQNENAYLAYGSVAARALDADQFTIAWSGKGVIRNYGGDTTDVLPSIYLRILPYDTTTLWDPSQWIPQVVFINLGTNDFSIGAPDKTAFTTAYVDFVEQIRSQYPNAHIYCALGPMLSDSNLTSARDYITTVVNQFISAGDTKVHFIEFPMQDGSLGYGEDWHPSVAQHAAMAEQLVSRLKTDLGW